jgi:hypothetical protein
MHAYCDFNFSEQRKAPGERKPNVLNSEKLNNETLER